MLLAIVANVRLAGDKRTSLFCLSISDEKKFLSLTPSWWSSLVRIWWKDTSIGPEQEKKQLIKLGRFREIIILFNTNQKMLQVDNDQCNVN